MYTDVYQIPMQCIPMYTKYQCNLYQCILIYTYIPMLCIPMYTYIYQCNVYPCILIYTNVMYTNVYQIPMQCIPMYTYIIYIPM